MRAGGREGVLSGACSDSAWAMTKAAEGRSTLIGVGTWDELGMAGIVEPEPLTRGASAVRRGGKGVKGLVGRF